LLVKAFLEARRFRWCYINSQRGFLGKAP
jgi:hypothetical protein